MADQSRPGSEFYVPPRRFKDNGDGTFSEVVALESGSIGGGGADPTYQEDTASAPAEKVIMAGVVRKDASGSLVDTDGDRTELQVDSSGQLRVVTPPGGAGLTNTELRASAVPVSGPQTDAEMRASPVPVSGPLTDTQLRASPVPVSGTVTASGPLTDTQLRAGAVPVSGPLTDAQLRASAVPVTIPSPTPVTGTFFQATQPVTDSPLAALIGLTADSPGAYTLLDRLSQLQKLARAQNDSLQVLINQGKPKVLPKTPTTLLHRFT